MDFYVFMSQHISLFESEMFSESFTLLVNQREKKMNSSSKNNTFIFDMGFSVNCSGQFLVLFPFLTPVRINIKTIQDFKGNREGSDSSNFIVNCKLHKHFI